jgi:hypothetical protein
MKQASLITWKSLSCWRNSSSFNPKDRYVVIIVHYLTFIWLVTWVHSPRHHSLQFEYSLQYFIPYPYPNASYPDHVIVSILLCPKSSTRVLAVESNASALRSYKTTHSLITKSEISTLQNQSLLPCDSTLYVMPSPTSTHVVACTSHWLRVHLLQMKATLYQILQRRTSQTSANNQYVCFEGDRP